MLTIAFKNKIQAQLLLNELKKSDKCNDNGCDEEDDNKDFKRVIMKTIFVALKWK